MSYYLVRHRGDPVAVVDAIELAQRIVRCRRRGHYSIEMIENDAGISTSNNRHPNLSVPRRAVKIASDHGESAEQARRKGSRHSR